MSFAINIPSINTKVIIGLKCGSHSLLTWLRAVIMNTSFEEAEDKNIHRVMFGLSHNGWIKGDSILVMRDPVDRLVSCYFNKISNPLCNNPKHKNQLYIEGLTLEGFIDKLGSDDKFLHENSHWIPQTNVLKRVKDNSKVTVVDLKNSSEFFSLLFYGEKLPSVEIINKKVEKRRYEGEPADYCTLEMIEKIKKIYAKDYEWFNRAVMQT